MKLIEYNGNTLFKVSGNKTSEKIKEHHLHNHP